ncbi:MAG: queuine tRNA-ribosyltransferase queuine tRNA-ribosyltransferase [Parcubacteria group bacterium]|nr:queuine tRNA-ribosyltransferase queuine tRNA-ribosyltransferase [Parcubacteria group bacterium]
MLPLNFNIEKEIEGELGRAGTLETPHGIIPTPAFVTVGTKGTVKALSMEDVKNTGADVVLANTYHLYLQPGDERIKKFGGLHRFMNWNGPLMTDSGGFQVFSLGAAYGKALNKVVSVTDPSQLIPERSSESDVPRLATIGSDGVSFRSHIDGSLHYITPEKSIEIQHNLGADIIFAFDECTSPTETVQYQDEALERTHRWAQKSLEYHKSKPNSEFQGLFGIVQGGREENLRKESALKIAEMKTPAGEGFDGFGIGGSFAKEDMSTAVKWVNEVLPNDKPRHLLGIGEQEDLFMGVENGVDLFDCVAPTRRARGGTLYTHEGTINIGNTRFIDATGPIDPQCGCSTCRTYSLGYLSHLYRSHEMLASTLGSIHNLYFIINLVKKMRQAILDGNFKEFKESFLKQYLD